MPATCCRERPCARQYEWISGLEGKYDIRIAHHLPREAALIQRMMPREVHAIAAIADRRLQRFRQLYEQLESFRRASCACSMIR